jgi:hypothetical protein
MSSSLSRTLSAAVLLAVTSLSWAQSGPAGAASAAGVDARQARQTQRIEQGAASGALTGREQRRLHREQKAIGQVEEKAKADGTVTRHERKRLHRMQNHAGRDIARQKHDGQHRGMRHGKGQTENPANPAQSTRPRQ